MASIRKHGGRWRAEVSRSGTRRSKILPTKRAAQDWAARQEYELANPGIVASKTVLGDVLDKYAREVSPVKRGHRWEVVRLEKLRRDPLAQVTMGVLGPVEIAEWRDRRLQEVSAASVRREMTLLSAVLTQARREWRLIGANPMTDVRKPAPPRPRDRLPSSDEMERLTVAAGDDLTKATARAFHAFRFACETAMRAGEIVGLTWDAIDLDRRTAHLPITKNGHPRTVPMTTRAVELLEMLPRRDPVFGLSSPQLDALWRKIRDRALVKDLHFHDSRAAALTALSRKVDVMTLAKISGHRDLRILQNTYYRETAESIAARLD